jgi:rubrerythrin
LSIEGRLLESPVHVRFLKLEYTTDFLCIWLLSRDWRVAGIIAELDAINLYEQMAAMTENENIKKILLDIPKEEKTHMGEFQAPLLRVDKEQVEELEEGKKEVEELTGSN